MFTTLVTKPVFNILVLILALIPGHNYGIAIIIFTALIRWAMFPLLKKQLKNTMGMRALQPEMRRIKKAAAGNRQTESMMTMELYRERGINPFSSVGLMLLQIPLFLAMYGGLKRVVDNPQALIDFSYSVLHKLPWLKEISGNIGSFDNTLVKAVDLSRKAIENNGHIYWPAMILVAASTLVQWLQIRQTTPHDKEARTLRQILSQGKSGKEADSAEVNAAVGRSMSYVFPFFIFFLTVNFAAALSLYWLVSGLVAYLQQAHLLKQDEYQLEALAAGKTTKPTSAKDSFSAPKVTIISSETKTSGPKKPAPATLKKRKNKRR